MASEVTIRRFVRALLEKKDDDVLPAGELKKPESPLKLSWSPGEHVMVCSEPRELAVKYATTLRSMGFKPGKNKFDHCWVQKNSDRFRHSEKMMRAFANRLVSAGANVDIEYEGKELSLTEARSLHEVFLREHRGGWIHILHRGWPELYSALGERVGLEVDRRGKLPRRHPQKEHWRNVKEELMRWLKLQLDRRGIDYRSPLGGEMLPGDVASLANGANEFRYLQYQGALRDAIGDISTHGG